MGACTWQEIFDEDRRALEQQEKEKAIMGASTYDDTKEQAAPEAPKAPEATPEAPKTETAPAEAPKEEK